MHTRVTSDAANRDPAFGPTSAPGSVVYLSLVCLVAAIGGLLFGFDTAVISGTVVRVKEQFELTEWTEGWFVSSAIVGCLLGSSIAGMLSDRFGRKKILILSGVLFLASAVGTTIPQTVFGLICGRLVGGLGVGMASMLSPLFISEFSPPRLRGRMVACYQLAITIGIVLAYFTNALLLYLSKDTWADLTAGPLRWILVDEVWRGMFATLGIPAVIFLFLLLFIPESPRWLCKQGRHEEARAILSKVGGPDVAAVEIKEIQETLAMESGSILQVFEPWLRRALLIGILLPIFSQVSGINVIIYYGPKIFEQANFTMGDALGGQVTIGLVNVLFTFVAIWKVDQFGRKPLLLAGITGLVCMLGLVSLLSIQGLTGGKTLVACFMAYCACFAASLGPIPWIVISEIFPNRIRGRAMSIGTFSIWAGCAAVALTFPWLNKNLGPAMTFWLYAVLLAPSFFFVRWFVPETKGKSLEEIEKSWHRQ